MNDSGLILPSDVRLSAEQRELQRQQMAQAIQFLLERQKHMEHVSEECFKALEAKLEQVHGATVVNDRHIKDVSQIVYDISALTFWQRMWWLVRGL